MVNAPGRGDASEAPAAVVRFAFGATGPQQRRAGHAADDHASKNAPRKLGFQPLETVERMSRSRGIQSGSATAG